jgi:hypothetical protein
MVHLQRLIFALSLEANLRASVEPCRLRTWSVEPRDFGRPSSALDEVSPKLAVREEPDQARVVRSTPGRCAFNWVAILSCNEPQPIDGLRFDRVLGLSRRLNARFLASQSSWANPGGSAAQLLPPNADIRRLDLSLKGSTL